MSTVGLVLASIPSPSSGTISIGPLELRAYGLMIALGVLAAVWLAQRRWSARGGDPDDIASIAMWAVPAGLVGARLYHVATDWRKYQGRWEDVVKIWEGGLGVPGGMALGVVVGLVVARRRGIAVPEILDAATPALPLAQAIGRWGNWFNQELFGGPTDLPWGLEIDPGRRPDEHLTEATFHPTFLYESLWNLALCLVLVRIDRAKVLKPGRLFAAYVLGYFVVRLVMELLRTDPASLVLGVRINIWTSLIGIAAGAWFVWTGRRRDEAAEPVA
ncbi:prolipoprotein diacylglyceryl transferase [Actinomarinicola tropica]|uniref:Phosphatidylglycerol--prolipoprotein diacylglyceryl transferase n=1 Tax=Actinomarinicola tropica TaxID=2789776 RepID=A0A5Q2RPB8_9ACTN|nr:prolipoprotein diacylglyceryl transferase [Actinomarinicola tropica]QGG95055.1 prolipoprotein diacylglyceryl transferase [Actinomarinicola tropica]